MSSALLLCEEWRLYHVAPRFDFTCKFCSIQSRFSGRSVSKAYPKQGSDVTTFTDPRLAALYSNISKMVSAAGFQHAPVSKYLLIGFLTCSLAATATEAHRFLSLDPSTLLARLVQLWGVLVAPVGLSALLRDLQDTGCARRAEADSKRPE